jgi:N-acetylglucosaminyltransferase
MGAVGGVLMLKVAAGPGIGLLITAAVYVLLSTAATILQRRFALRHRYDADRWDVRGRSEYHPSIDVVVTCFNEPPELFERCLESLAGQRYDGELRVWIVDDGSSNRAALLPVYDRYRTRPGWQVLMLPRNLGKRLAQDEAVYRSDGELVVSIDSDTVVSEDGIAILAASFSDPKVGMATGDVRASNRGTNWLTALVDSRYEILFAHERAAQSYFDSVLCCSGSFAMYRRSAMSEVWPRYLAQTFAGMPCTWGEDLHLTTRILAEGYRSLYQPLAKATTSVPDTLKGYVRQQLRWNRSFYRELWWIIPLLMRRPPYLALDVAARLLLPLMLPAALVLTALDTVGQDGTLPRDAAVFVGMVLTHWLLGVWQTRKLGFSLLYGVIYAGLLIPARIWALCTLGDTRWGTRRDRPLPAGWVAASHRVWRGGVALGRAARDWLARMPLHWLRSALQVSQTWRHGDGLPVDLPTDTFEVRFARGTDAADQVLDASPDLVNNSAAESAALS